MRLDLERYTGRLQLVYLAQGRSSFDHAARATEILHVVIPVSEKGRLGQLDFLGQDFAQHFLQPGNHSLCHFDLFLSELHDGTHLLHVE